MKVIGLTGGIGCGKSTVTKMLRRKSIPVFDADATVHYLMKRPSVITTIRDRFPEAISNDNRVLRPVLRDMAQKDPKVLDILADIFNQPLVVERNRFLGRHRTRHTPIVVLDVPLLFEMGWETICDFTLSVTAPRNIQQQRVLSRPGMTLDNFKFFESRQLSTQKRNRLADIIIHSGWNKAHVVRQINRLIYHWRNRI